MPNFIPHGHKHTVAVVAPGWSLTREQADLLEQHSIFTIAIGNAYKLFPKASVLYHADTRWWEAYDEAFKHPAHKVSMGQILMRRGEEVLETAEHLGVDYLLPSKSYVGLDQIPGTVVMGNNSGYQAMNLAAQYQPSSILMLGFDLCLDPEKGVAHFDGNHPEGVYRRSPYHSFIASLSSMKEALSEQEIRVYNCNQHSALTCYQKMDLEECLTKLA